MNSLYLISPHAHRAVMMLGLAVLLFANVNFAGARNPEHPGKEWRSASGETLAIKRPEDGRAVIEVADQTPTGYVQRVAYPPMPRVQSEWHGTHWLTSTQPLIVSGRYWVFQDQSGICIIDHKEARMLVNHVLEPVVHDESRLVWVAMAQRRVGRHDEFLPEGSTDSLKIILLGNRADQEAAAPQIYMVKLPGIAFSPPVFNPVGDKAVVAVGLGPEVVAVVVELATGELTAQHPLPHKVTPGQMVQLSFQDLFTDIIRQIASEIR